MPVACMIAIGHGRTDRGVRMHVTRFAATVLLALPLGGCFGVTLPSQPLPDWAMSPQAQSDEPRSDQASGVRAKKQRIRSEEHTSELQSRQYLVCRLLLEKKNNKAYSGLSAQAKCQDFFDKTKNISQIEVIHPQARHLPVCYNRIKHHLDLL